MTTPPANGRKIQQLDNDVQAIYEMIAGLTATQQRHSNRLDEIATTQEEHTRILGEHTRILGEHTRILGDHTHKLDSHDAKLDEILALLRGPS